MDLVEQIEANIRAELKVKRLSERGMCIDCEWVPVADTYILGKDHKRTGKSCITTASDAVPARNLTAGK